MQYLFLQTGQALQEMNPDSEQTAELIEDLNVEEREEDEGFCDINNDHTIRDLEVVLSPRLSTLTLGSFSPVTSSATSVLGSSATSLVSDISVLAPDLPQLDLPQSDSPVHLELEDAEQEGDEEMVCCTIVFSINKNAFI